LKINFLLSMTIIALATKIQSKRHEVGR